MPKLLDEILNFSIRNAPLPTGVTKDGERIDDRRVTFRINSARAVASETVTLSIRLLVDVLVDGEPPGDGFEVVQYSQLTTLTPLVMNIGQVGNQFAGAAIFTPTIIMKRLEIRLDSNRNQRLDLQALVDGDFNGQPLEWISWPQYTAARSQTTFQIWALLVEDILQQDLVVRDEANVLVTQNSRRYETYANDLLREVEGVFLNLNDRIWQLRGVRRLPNDDDRVEIEVVSEIVEGVEVT